MASQREHELERALAEKERELTAARGALDLARDAARAEVAAAPQRFRDLAAQEGADIVDIARRIRAARELAAEIQPQEPAPSRAAATRAAAEEHRRAGRRALAANLDNEANRLAAHEARSQPPGAKDAAPAVQTKAERVAALKARGLHTLAAQAAAAPDLVLSGGAELRDSMLAAKARLQNGPAAAPPSPVGADGSVRDQIEASKAALHNSSKE